MAEHPARNLSVRCAVRQSGRVTCENLQRGSSTAITSATPVTARLPPERFKGLRRRHDNRRRFEVPCAPLPCLCSPPRCQRHQALEKLNKSTLGGEISSRL